eukprot:4361959-Alexandrium_andersonii.AAC.1
MDSGWPYPASRTEKVRRAASQRLGQRDMLATRPKLRWGRKQSHACTKILPANERESNSFLWRSNPRHAQ